MTAVGDVNSSLKEAIHTGESTTEYLFYYNFNFCEVNLKCTQARDQFTWIKDHRFAKKEFRPHQSPQVLALVVIYSWQKSLTKTSDAAMTGDSRYSDWKKYYMHALK